MTDIQTIELCKAIGDCSASLSALLRKSSEQCHTVYDVDNGLLENFGYVLALLFVGQGLDINEVGSCIACFVGCNGASKLDFENVAKSFDFYAHQIAHLEECESNHFFIGSCICYNLLYPTTWDYFSQSIPLQKMNGLQLMQLWPIVLMFGKTEMPKIVNPILVKL